MLSLCRVESCTDNPLCAARFSQFSPASGAKSIPVPSKCLRRLISQSLEANNKHFNEAREKLEKWADDLVLAAEKALKDTKEQIKILQRQARLATHLAEQHDIQQKIQKLEKQQRRQRQAIFQVEDSIIEKRDGLIESLERRLTQKTEVEQLFIIEWAVI